MELSEIFEVFSKKMTELVQLQLSMRQLAVQELKALREQKEILGGLADEELPMSASNMMYRSAIDGSWRYFGAKKMYVDDLIKGVYIHKNKQYQWLLAEAYEAYEDFVEDVYAWAGLHDKGLWPIADYTNLTLEDLQCLSFEQLRELAGRKKNRPHSMLGAFRKRYTSFSVLEKANALGVDLRFFVHMVEKLRHAIVHNGGVVGDVNKFAEKIIKESAVVKRQEQEEAKNWILSLFRQMDGESVVYLLEVPSSMSELSRLGAFHDICGNMIQMLVTHAELITQCCEQKNT